MAGPEDWGAVPVAAQEPDGPAAWGAIPQEPQVQPAPDQIQTEGLKSRMSGVLRSFGEGYEKGYGHEAVFQLSDEHLKNLKDSVPDALAPVIEAGHNLVTAALGNTRWGAIAGSPEFLAHQMNAVYAGLQASVTEAIPGNLGRDLASMPDAFFGMPHALSAPKPFVKETPIVPIEGPPAVRPRSELARTGDPLVDAVLDHPTVREVINNPVIDREHEVPNSWGGSLPIDNPATYIDRDFPKHLTIGGKTIDPAEAAAVHENAEMYPLQKMMAAGMSRDAALRVAYWEFGNPAEHAWYEANGIDPAEAEAVLKPHLDRIAERTADADRIPSDLFKETYPDGDPLKDIPGEIDKPSPEEVKQGREIVGGAIVEDALQGMKDREPAPDLAAARDAGVIGPDEPLEAKRAEDVPKVMAARRAPDDRITQEVGGEKPVDRWEQRWKQFTGKIDKPEDVQQIIREAATDDNGNFEAARRGDIKLRPMDQHRLGEAAGVDPATIDPEGIGRNLRNDNQVRVAMQMMLHVAELARQAGEDLSHELDSVEKQIAFHEAMMRRDVAVEQIVGLRAEWGRTGNVFQEFLKQVKEQEAITEAVKQAGKEGETRSPEERKRDTLNAFLRENGSSAERLQQQANQVQGLTPKAAAKYLSQQRDFPAPSLPFWLWVQGLISGPFTHAKYVLANGLYAMQEHIITPAVAAAMGTLRMDPRRVFFGEPMSATYGMITAMPDAFKAYKEAMVNGVRSPLKSEIEVLKSLQDQYDGLVAADQKIPRTLLKQIREYDRVVNPITQMGTPEAIKNMGLFGRLLGLPGDNAMGIHTFFKVLGERASLNAQAYRKATLETKADPNAGLWDRFNAYRENPDIDMHIQARAEAYKGTFMQELGPRGKAWQDLTKNTPGLKWLFPFSHIPINLMKASYEYTPFALLDSQMKADIKGENGQIAADKARARVVIGSAVMTYFGWQALNDGMTGEYPRDRKEQERWKMMGIQPNSVRVGDWWVSLNKFGPAGNLAQLGANLVSAGKVATSNDDNAMFSGIHHAASAAVNLIKDEVGMLSLAMFLEAVNDPNKGSRWVGNTAASLMPYSSALGQAAAFMDPHAREVKGVTNAILYKVPLAREGLPEKRNVFGEPVYNPAYHSIVRQAPVATDKVTLEMDRLGMHPAAPHNVIGGVKLSPEQASQYQSKAGSFARTGLEALMQDPGYANMPDETKIETVKQIFKTAHAQARAIVQAGNDNIISQGIEQKLPKQVR
jgi:hypothetical protein